MQEQPRIVDLFCGCGGFSLGAHAAGLAPTTAFDVDPVLTSSFGTNFPKTTLKIIDLSRAKGTDIERESGGHIDGVFGGPPCQAFSAIGHRNKDDPRRSLLGHFFRLVSELQPAFFVMENVKGLGYEDARPVLEAAIGVLPNFYTVLGPIILDAADFGAATKRPRLFVIGFDPVRFDPLTMEDINAQRRKPSTVRDAIAELSSSVPINEEDGFDRWKIVRPGRPNRYAANMRSPDRIFTGHRQTIHTKNIVARFKEIEQGGVDPVGRHPRLSWNGQCPTLRAGTGSDRGSFQSVRPIHPEEPRVITVREGARLQGFPDSFKFHPTIWHSFRMIGNSVSPIMSKALFSAIAPRLKIGGRYAVAAE